MQFQLVLNPNMFSNVCFQLPHDLLIDLGWSIDTCEMAPIRCHVAVVVPTGVPFTFIFFLAPHVVVALVRALEDAQVFKPLVDGHICELAALDVHQA
jgi:hypothetical protein